MLEHVALQRCSGRTIASYAKLIGVSHYKMQYWVNKYKARQKTQKIESDNSLKFIDLESFGHQSQPVITGIPAPSLAERSSQDERFPQMTLTFSNGMCLKIY
jgi:hypothetical protein